jgi:ABC-type uncharacterized transport system fused permease/ATPase subunit
MILILFYALLTASFSYAIDEWIQEGMIFGFYGKWLEKTRYKNNGPGKVVTERWYYKPLGGCVICANVWHSVIFCLVMGLSLHWSVAIIFISNLFVRKMID